PVIDVRPVLQAEDGPGPPAAATPDVTVMWRLPVHLRGHGLGEEGRLGTGVEQLPRIGDPGALVRNVALVGFAQVATEVVVGQAEHPTLAGDHGFVAAGAALEVLKETAPVLLRLRKVEGEQGVAVLESAVDESGAVRFVAPLVDVHVGPADESWILRHLTSWVRSSPPRQSAVRSIVVGCGGR